MDGLTQAQPTMERSKRLRLCTILLLYVAQGIPIGLFDFAIPAWMAANGATGGEIGYVVGMIGIPWSLKFFNGFLMDRYTFLAMGRRRAWLIGAQLAMVLALVGSAYISPEPRDAVMLGLVALVVNSAVVFQDVAADALAVDLTAGEERGFVGGLMAGGQALGIAISAAASSYLIFLFGSAAAYLACAAIMAIVFTYLVWVRERQGEKRLPWLQGNIHEKSLQLQTHAWVPLLKYAFKSIARRQSLTWIVCTFLIGTAYGTLTVSVPLLAANYAGWNEAQLGSANGVAQLAAAFATITLGGMLTARLGSRRFLIIAMLLFAGFVSVYLTAQSSWDNSSVMWAFVIGWTVLYFIVNAPRSAITVNFCNPKAGASQFSIYMAFANQGISFAGFTFAIVEGWGGLPGVLGVLVGIMLMAALVASILRLPCEIQDADHAAAALVPAE